MANVVLGVDPGLTGGLAVLTLGGDVVDVRVMPTAKCGGKNEVDAAALAAFVREVKGKHKLKLAAVEQVGAMPSQGVVSMFSFGAGYGAIRGVLAALGVPVELPRPQEWQRHVFQGMPSSKDKAKDKSRGPAYCARRFPGLSLKMTPRSKKDHDGVGDAVCIGEWARRLVAGEKGEKP